MDTQGQRLSHRDELLGINGYSWRTSPSASTCPAQRNRILGLVYSHAVSGGFLASSMLADTCYALPEAEIRDEPAGHGARHEDPAGAAGRS